MAQPHPHSADGFLGKGEDIHTGPVVTQTVHPKDAEVTGSSDHERTGAPLHAVGTGNEVLERDAQSKGRWFQYLKTKQFWLTLLLGQGGLLSSNTTYMCSKANANAVLAICITSTNTLSSLLANEGTSIPAFQSFFNYVLLNLIYTTYTIYKYGFKKWGRLVIFDGWRFFILAFFDVEGNYFVVLAYRYTTILSAQLINFWAIVIVVVISFSFLKVRYHYTQIAGILFCIGGLGVIFGSDQITGSNSFGASDQVKGDLFALLGATFYGLSNVFEEYLVSEKPLYEVVGQLAFWGMFINGTQAGIFDRTSFRNATWNSKVGGYLTGYTFILTLFYSLAPVLFRLSSAAFFNISLLTGSFWGVAIGVKVLGLSIHWMYPIAFVLIILGQVLYFIRQTTLSEALKPWLGADQSKGVAGVGTARRRVENPGAIV
jgi:solute carrier family 35 protein F1/2